MELFFTVLKNKRKWRHERKIETASHGIEPWNPEDVKELMLMMTIIIIGFLVDLYREGKAKQIVCGRLFPFYYIIIIIHFTRTLVSCTLKTYLPPTWSRVTCTHITLLNNGRIGTLVHKSGIKKGTKAIITLLLCDSVTTNIVLLAEYNRSRCGIRLHAHIVAPPTDQPTNEVKVRKRANKVRWWEMGK